MKFDLQKPCAGCPYTKTASAVRLPKRRTQELIDYVTKEPGATFPCHKTVDHESRDNTSEQFCVGALLFAKKQDRYTRMQRMAIGLGLLDMDKLKGEENVFDSPEEMLEKAR
jgi:hypothetical protein